MIRVAVEPISVSTKEASKLTGIPPTTLRDMAKRGDIKGARRVGNKSWIFVLNELREHVNGLPKIGAN